ncbi:MAG: prenyltransferase [Levilactobacillus sp.]|uniref:prenyltransferase n=1 Tax=Levilactobacillus sp. TaxID=2767919 RepID=UPI002590C760|nr:prenyltransferase [Levilactobacillus sp.]MCI1554439.1 prenyltransferase [Levilactobacillus sp.]MCI1598230.1 prenyltransferase [Levilactobacillus sp.]MCI1605921.1 prenyltransferase [Levilactobacillus sp.]
MSRWLTWPVFYELTEIYTAPLNVMWFILGAAIAQYYAGTVNWVNVGLCLLVVFIFDLAVNVADNYYDYRHAHDRTGYAQQINPIGRLALPESGVAQLAWGLYALAAVPGVVLVLRTGWPVAVFGAVGYLIGIFYTAGPRPINATPVSAIVVALAIAFLIQLTCVYVSIYGERPLTWSMVGVTFLLCLPLTLIFFTLQLANDTADRAEDIANHRYTLAYYLGQPGAVRLIQVVVVAGSLWPLVNVALGIAPVWTALAVLLLPVMWRGMQPFFAVQDKRRTFMTMVKSAALFFVAYPLLFALGTWL